LNDHVFLNQGGGKALTLPLGRKLHSVKSSPQLVLNEICEEDESDGNNSGEGGSSCFRPSSTRLPPSTTAVAALAALRPATLGVSPVQAGPVRCRLTKRQFVRKLPSCSSSDASDEDSESRAKKNSLPFPWRRRDSQEDSSDAGTK
jgi:hypothetical protein